MLQLLLFGCIVFPLIAAVAVALDKEGTLRRRIVYAGTGITALSALGLALYGSFVLPISPDSSLQPLMTVLDLALLVFILYVAVNIRHRLSMGLALGQLAGMIYLDFFMLEGHQATAFLADPLALVMVLVISLVGGIVCIFGLGYMQEHEDHLRLAKSKQSRFFFFLLLFGSIQSKIYSESGAAFSIADTIMSKLLRPGASNTKKNVIAVAVIVAIGVILCMGGINASVFIVLMYPVALTIFEYCDIPKRFILGVLAAASYTFTLTMPGSPQVTNVAAMTALALLLTRTPGALLLGLFMGVMELIPYIGPFIAGVPAVLLALQSGWTAALWTLLAICLVQQVEANLLSPRLLSGATRLHPLAVLLAIAFGGMAGGVVGMMAALPLVVCVRGAVRGWRE